MSFILDALRKSEHERQRSALPGLAQVPLATPPAQLPRWTLVVIGVLAAAVLLLGGAWWQSKREVEVAAAPPVVERSLPLPPPAATTIAPSSPALAEAAPPAPEAAPPASAAGLATAAASAAPESVPTFDDPAPEEPALPSAAALAAEGIQVPPMRLELHRFREQARDRFVFINGRKYVEGDRLTEGPQLVSIVPRGAVLVHAGRRFLLLPE